MLLQQQQQREKSQRERGISAPESLSFSSPALHAMTDTNKRSAALWSAQALAPTLLLLLQRLTAPLHCEALALPLPSRRRRRAFIAAFCLYPYDSLSLPEIALPWSSDVVSFNCFGGSRIYARYIGGPKMNVCVCG